MEDFKSIIDAHHPILYKIGRSYASAEDFDDLYQEMLINLWKGLQSFSGKSKLSTWIYRVVLNTALTYNRNNKRKKVSQVPVEQIKDAMETDSRQEQQEQEDDIKRLYVAIRTLPKDDRSIMLLYLEEKSYDEIAEIIGIKRNNVAVKINRAKKKLYELLTENNYGRQ